MVAVGHKCFCIEMCFAFLAVLSVRLSVTLSRFATRRGRTVAMPSPRFSEKRKH